MHHILVYGKLNLHISKMKERHTNHTSRDILVLTVGRYLGLSDPEAIAVAAEGEALYRASGPCPWTEDLDWGGGAVTGEPRQQQKGGPLPSPHGAYSGEQPLPQALPQTWSQPNARSFGAASSPMIGPLLSRPVARRRLGALPSTLKPQFKSLSCPSSLKTNRSIPWK